MNCSDEQVDDMQSLAIYIRQWALRMVTSVKSSHIGSCLSAAEITAVVQTIANKSEDVFIFSKGHAAATLYAALAGLKLIPEELLETFGKDGSELTGHVNHAIPNVSYSSGSLGHGLPYGVGVAIGSKHKKVYVLISDGELNEGTTWESLAIANHLGLGNLTLVVDANGIQRTVGTLCADTHPGAYSEQDAYSGRLIPVLYQNNQTDARIKEEPKTCQTVIARWGTGGGHTPLVRNTMAVRRLTPTECERLQGFPDGWTDIYEATPDGPRYKAIGNSMAVPVMRWIGSRIQACR